LEIFNLLTAIADGSQGMGYVKACLVSWFYQKSVFN
jgi:hypothetical protein